MSGYDTSMNEWMGKDNKTRGTGSNGRTAKLNDEKVRAIKTRVRDGEKQTELAKEFGVNKTTIGDIVRGRSWNHVKIEG